MISYVSYEDLHTLAELLTETVEALAPLPLPLSAVAKEKLSGIIDRSHHLLDAP